MSKKLNQKEIKLGALLAVVAAAALVLGTGFGAFFSGSGDGTGELIHVIQEDFPEGISVDGTTVIDGSGNWDGAVTGTTGTFSSTLGVTGLSTFSGGVVVGATSVATTTTLTSADFGEFITLDDSDGGSTITLPAATAGGSIKIAVGTAFGTANAVIASAEGDNIDGTLLVNGASVACAGEDQINIVHTAELVGDFVELYSVDGSNWLIGPSMGQAAGALTCTDPS